MTNKDFEFLAGYEKTFTTAVYSNFARNLGSQHYDPLNTIYEHITGSKYPKNWGCPHCTLKFMKELGKLYFEEKQRREEIKQKRIESMNKAKNKNK